MAPDNRATHLREIRARMRDLMIALANVKYPSDVAAILAPVPGAWIAIDKHLSDAEQRLQGDADASGNTAGHDPA